MYSPVCRSRRWLLRLCVNSLYCFPAVREYRESMGEAHTHPQLQAHTDSWSLCSSASPDSPTPAPTQDIPYFQLWAFTGPSTQFPPNLCYLKAETCSVYVWFICFWCVYLLCSHNCFSLIPVPLWRGMTCFGNKHCKHCSALTVSWFVCWKKKLITSNIGFCFIIEV